MNDELEDWSGIDWSRRAGGDTSSFDWGNVDFGVPSGDTIGFNFGRGQGLVDIPTEGFETKPYLDFEGNLTFETGDGRLVKYTPEGVVQTSDPSGRNSFYTTNEGQDYFIDYSNINEPGSLTEIFGRAIGGEGPTRYTAYHGLGPDAKVVDYSNVYGPGGGTVTTTGADGDQVIYKDGTVTTSNVNNNTIEKIINRMFGGNTTKNDALLAALLGGLMGLLGKGSGSTGSKGYQGAIPKYTAVRGPSVSPTAGGRRPGGAGIGSLAGTTKYVPAATGGLMDMAEGGRPARYLRGGTDGMADKIKTDIDGKQPARLSHGEFVIPADVVSHLGNGNSDAGADVLYEMMDKVRTARTGTKKQGKQINPRKYTPA